MAPIFPFDGSMAGVQWVYWIVLAVFFVLTIPGWALAVKVWQQDEKAADEPQEEPGETHS